VQSCTPHVNWAGGGIVAFHIYVDALGKWRWYLRDADHRKIATSGGSFTEKSHCLDALKLVLGLDGDTPVYED
jgi:uncharacterized protein YegP (UPF0339 family)